MITWKILIISIILTIIFWCITSYHFYRVTMDSLLIFIQRYEAMELAEEKADTTEMKTSFFLQKGEMEKNYPVLYRHMSLYQTDMKQYRKDIFRAAFRTGFISFFF